MYEIPGYTINALLAEGACAEIYAGVEHSTGRLIALKILHRRHKENKSEHKRLIDEGALCMKLGRHDNIVQTYKCGTAGDTPYVVMEYVNGRTLREILVEQHKLGNMDVLRLAKGLARGLRFLHNAGVCHKDLKPDNIMLTKEGEVKMLDFGFAENVKSFKLFRRSLEGSLPYMAPEMFTVKQATIATDIYSLGCTLYEAAAGIQPFGGMSEKEIIARQTNMKYLPPPIRETNPAISVYTERTILSALQKDIAKRFKSADEILLDLARNPALRDARVSTRMSVPKA